MTPTPVPCNGPTTGNTARSRRWLTVVALLPLLLAGCPRGGDKGGGSDGGSDKEITVGILHSQTGTMAISEKSLIDAEQLAIEEINAKGGLLGGKTVKAVVTDPQSKFTDVFP